MMAEPSWATMPPKSVVTVVPLLVAVVEKGGGVSAGRPAWICPVRVNTHRSGSSEQEVAAGSSSMASTRHTSTMMAFLGNTTVSLSHIPHIVCCSHLAVQMNQTVLATTLNAIGGSLLQAAWQPVAEPPDAGLNQFVLFRL